MELEGENAKARVCTTITEKYDHSVGLLGGFIRFSPKYKIVRGALPMLDIFSSTSTPP